MEIDKRAPEIENKVWNIMRIVLYMVKRSKAKRKIMVELSMLMKKGRNAGKAISNLLLLHHHHYSALTCRSNDATTSFVSPRDYEFSCSNTPIYPKRKNHHHHHHHYHVEELKVMHKVFGILSRYDVVDSSPLPVTDSPALSTKDDHDHDHEILQVDRDAEEFIKKFYRELKKQKPIAASPSPSPALESPTPYHDWA